MSTLDEEDRREYYRIEDRVALEIHALPASGELGIDSGDGHAALYDLLAELHVSEFETQHLLRQLDDRDRATNGVLRALNKRIDLLGKVVAQAVLGELGELKDVWLSEGGVQFESAQPFSAGQAVSVRMVLMPQASGMLLRGRITHCAAHSEGHFEVGVEFIDLPDAQRQLLARHILQRQAQQRRQAREQSGPSST